MNRPADNLALGRRRLLIVAVLVALLISVVGTAHVCVRQRHYPAGNAGNAFAGGDYRGELGIATGYGYPHSWYVVGSTVGEEACFATSEVDWDFAAYSPLVPVPPIAAVFVEGDGGYYTGINPFHACNIWQCLLWTFDWDWATHNSYYEDGDIVIQRLVGSLDVDCLGS